MQFSTAAQKHGSIFYIWSRNKMRDDISKSISFKHSSGRSVLLTMQFTIGQPWLR